MRRRIFWQYLLVGTGWVLAAVSMPMRGADLNGFLTWRGTTNTEGLVRWFFLLLRMVASEWSDPTVRGGVRAGGRVAASTFAFGDLLWLAGVLLGFMLFLLAPVMVRRNNQWTRTGQTVIRCLAPMLLIFPAATLAPKVWGLPLPGAGMWVLSAAHVLVCIALMMTGAMDQRQSAFPVELETP
jgi:hypothetical protein